MPARRTHAFPVLSRTFSLRLFFFFFSLSHLLSLFCDHNRRNGSCHKSTYTKLLRNVDIYVCMCCACC